MEQQKDISAIKVTKIDDFKEYKPARVSQELYNVTCCRWKLSVLGYRLMFAIAQAIDYNQKELFPELGFDLKAVFRYLNLTNVDDRYNRLRDTLMEIRKGGLDIAEQTSRGKIRYFGYPWITYYQFETDGKMLYIRINDYAKSFLHNLKQYAQILPKYYLRLSTEYQNWFYPYLKNVVKLGRWRVAINDLKMALYLENTPSYDSKQNKNATEYFLNRVVGIQISEKAKLENRMAKAQKREPKLIEWEYVKDKDGNYTGTLASITANTDINVTASVEKTGRSYTHVVFFLSMKRQRQIGTQKTQVTETNSKRRTKKTSHIGDLFNSTVPELISNPAFETDIPVPQNKLIKTKTYTKEQLEDFAKESHITIPQAAKLLKVAKDKDGNYTGTY